MSGAGLRLAPAPSPGSSPAGRSPLAHLLHALNQPLTGLQCSLELAAAGPQRMEQYVRTLREGLELTGRMRVLVEAMRELTELSPPNTGNVESLSLDTLIRMAVDELVPVAETRRVRLGLLCHRSLPVRGDRRHLTAVLFRTLESALSLTLDGSEMRIAATAEKKQARVAVTWSPGPAPEHSPFSPAELGLLIARAGWERGGADWAEQQSESKQICGLHLSLTLESTDNLANGEGLK